MNLVHDLVFAVHIHVGGGLIKDIHGTVVEQCPGQGQTLALAAGEVASALLELGVQPLLAAEEGGQIYLLQHCPQLVVQRLRAGQQQVVPHRALEEIASVSDVGAVGHEAVLGQGGQLLAP